MNEPTGIKIGELFLTIGGGSVWLRERTPKGVEPRVTHGGEVHFDLRSHFSLESDLKIIRLDAETQRRLKALLKLRPETINLEELLAEQLQGVWEMDDE
jgi:hypothetical protein